MVKKVLPGKVPNYVWEQDTKADIGNLVIVVIDDEWKWSEGDPDSLNPDEAVLAQLRYQSCEIPDVRGIGFFPLPPIKEDVPIILEFVQQWLDCMVSSDTRVYFLVDALYGPASDNNFEAANCVIDNLTTSPNVYPEDDIEDNIGYLTKAGPGIGTHLRDGYKRFEKTSQAFYAQKHGRFRPNLMSFLGKGWHKDRFIDNAIQLYAQAWEARWTVKGWKHKCFEDKVSDQLRSLAAWLDISIDALYFSPDEGESAKSLMIWDADCLWESAPGRASGRRPIQGKVLNAVLNKLGIPFDPVPNEEFIAMPCVPCFPFLVSLRSVLWRCKKEGSPVEKMDFSRTNSLNVFSLTLPLASPPRLGLDFDNSLKSLSYCKTGDLTDSREKDYMCLFTDGPGRQVVRIVTSENQIAITWRGI